MKDIFEKKEKISVPSFNVGTIFNRKMKTGDVGIEIEVEGRNLPDEEDTPTPWVYKVDHSLRGDENAEYVLFKPVPFDKVDDALERLWKRFKAKNTVLDESNRTSVHVHLNCLNFHLDRLASFMGLYFLFEELLTQWCGEHRVGNLFCLRGIDAPAIVSQAKLFVKRDGQFPLYDNLHYAGLNIHSLSVYGSAEIRTLRGCSEPSTISNWVRILRKLYDLSDTFEDPREVCAGFSGEGPVAYFYRVFDDMAPVLLGEVGWDENQLSEALRRGVRLAQDICYCRDWSAFKALKIKPDPFGRNTKKIAEKLVPSNPEPQMGQEINPFGVQAHNWGPPVTLEEAMEQPEPPDGGW